MTWRTLLVEIPAYLRERVRPLSDPCRDDDGEFVLYWMHHAARGHENPALDTALEVAARCGRPVLVYQGLGGRHRFNADRHHAFILEGARDAASELTGRGVRHVFHLPPDPASPSPLLELARRACLVVAEEFPAPPFPRWTARLAARVDRPVWCADAACVVPMQSIGGFVSRAFQFRSRTEREFSARVDRRTPEAAVAAPAWDGPLPFSPVDLEDADLAELCAGCDIDHTIAPVPHTRGGSVAGYARWDRFRREGLRGYVRRRNDAAADGVSRMSPYLHHGHVSPFRVAREAHAVEGAGPGKFLDELLVWRELAHNLCFHRGDAVERLDVLPEWARRTLREHASDLRERVLSWETLARGRTGDRLWDAAQRSLVRQGELHNNIRMTWAKALPAWTSDAAEALRALIDLNHRFALDGNDPNSYGGLLWALGLFDRPFPPELPILGSVRPRPSETHAARLDLEKYEAKVGRPARGRVERVAVIGAGIAGLTAARTLADHGLSVTVFEKARGPGGRTARRRHDDQHFDHGAQYISARHPHFVRLVESWMRDGVVAEWPGRLVRFTPEGRHDAAPVRRFVAVPGMSALARHLAVDLDVRFGRRVARLARTGDAWSLRFEDGAEEGPFDFVVASPPAPQAVVLLADSCPQLASAAATARMQPCWTVMLAFDERLPVDFDGAFVEPSGPLRWIARNASKPGRPPAETWIVNADHPWTLQHLERPAEEVADTLASAFFGALGIEAVVPRVKIAHRWRYALVEQSVGTPCLFDADLGLAACGDWCLGPRVEAAFLSGAAAAGRVLGSPAHTVPEDLFAGASAARAGG